MKVTLHRGMPSSHINLEPTKTHFYLDTLKNSKKIRIGPTPYPNDVEVDPEAAEASMEGGSAGGAKRLNEIHAMLCSCCGCLLLYASKVLCRLHLAASIGRLQATSF